jgi:hypothetical protein
MQLLTKDILKKIPARGEDSSRARVYVKFFHPLQRWTWYATEYDPDNGRFFGYVKSGIDPAYDELGYFSLKELESIRKPLPLERDLYWNDKTTIGQVQKGEVS